MRINLFLFLIAISLGLSACQTFTKNGTGPITFSPNSMASFGQFQNLEDPMFFAISADGKSISYSYCFIGYMSGCVNEHGQRVIASCNEKAKGRGVDCSLFAKGSQILWDGPLYYEEFNGDFLFIFRKNVVGGSRSIRGIGRLDRGNQKIAIRAGQCTGEANLNTKKWFLKDCSNGDAISGTFNAGEGMKKYVGLGRTGGGGEVKMLLLDPSSSSNPKFTKAKASSYSSGTSVQTIANKSKSDICNGLKYGNPDFVKEAKRRGITEKSCTNQKETKITKSPGKGTLEDRLAKLKTLLSQGLLTSDEAAAKRKEILEGL